MLKRIRYFFAAQVIEGDEEQTRVARLLNIILVAFVFITFIFAVIGPFIYPEPYPSTIFFIVQLLLWRGARILVSRGYVRLASTILATVLWLMATTILILSGGMSSPYVLTFVTVVLIAGLLLGAQGGILFTGLSVFSGVVIVFLEVNGILPTTPWLAMDTTFIRLVVLAANMAIVAIFQYLTWNSLNQALDSLRHSQAALAAKVEETQKWAETATAANNYKSELIARVSHELRTPLGSILGLSEMIGLGVVGTLSDEQQEVMEKIVKNANYLQELVSDLLDQSRIASGQLVLNLAPFSPIELVQHISAAVSALVREKNLDYKTEVAPDLPASVVGDPDRTRQILINLVRNAIKFTEKGSVTVRVYCPDREHWAMQVQDTGIGFPKDAQEAIFEPFRQLRSELTQKKGGVGLGLSIVKYLTNQMDGQISVESEVGHGSTFTIILPLVTGE